jgi:predicted NUDIX family NTP pyrophosphohydrolase
LHRVAGKRSAGILPFRRDGDAPVEVLLVHPGGPFWAKRDEGAWSIPKGEPEDREESLACALREVEEELGPGFEPGAGEPIELGSVRQRAGKVVEAWALEGRFDPAALAGNTFTVEWPPRSGKQAELPEVDRAEWFDPPAARAKIIDAQAELIERLLEQLG